MRNVDVSDPEHVGCQVRTADSSVACTAGWLFEPAVQAWLLVCLGERVDSSSRFMNGFVCFVLIPRWS